MIERRRTHRYLFEVPVEVILEQSQDRIRAVTGDLGLNGCFVKTTFSFPVGSTVSLKITEGGRSFSATGEVIYLLTNVGMGIHFLKVATRDSAVLQEWMDEKNAVANLVRS